MTDEEVLAAMQSDSRLNQVRRVFASESARIEQAYTQRRSPTPIEVRRMEFDAAEKIAAVFPAEPRSSDDEVDYVAMVLCRSFYSGGTIYEAPDEVVINTRWPEWRPQARAAIEAVKIYDAESSPERADD